jgi:hypothetical protein
MDRETITIETPIDKHVVVLKKYITGREQRALTNIFVSGVKDMKVSTINQDVNVPEVNTGLLDKAEDEAWRLVISSIDGHKDGDTVDGKVFSVIDTVLDMKLKDYEAVSQKVKEITQDKQFEVQKKI